MIYELYLRGLDLYIRFSDLVELCAHESAVGTYCC